jgi:hypothetical protein
MSESKRYGDEKQSARDDLEDAVLAADDTGMVRGEAQIVAVELQEVGELGTETIANPPVDPKKP